ncbi:MAG: hypothetical protein IJX02_02875 [Clostridia bacterium]|nr:hypothetical protein [Clostridia bacterium]
MYENRLEEILNSEFKAYELLDFIDNDEFEKELIEFTQYGIKESVLRSFPSENSRKLTMLALTFIALKYYDGGFWNHVCEKFDFLGYEDKLIESKIRDNILGQIISKYHCERRHYQIPVMNSIIPLSYAANYIEFVDDIYTRNLDCDLSAYRKELDEELENIFNAIKDKLTDNDDTFNYNYEKSNKKAYKLIRATKNIIKTGVKKQELILITKEILKKLDAFYNGKKLISNQYVEKAFSEWFKENKDRKNSRREKTNFKKSKFPYYTFLKDTVYLHTPVKRLYGDYDTSLFCVEVYEGEKLIEHTTNLKIQSLLGGIEILQCNYKVKNPLGKIKCVIKYSDEEVYSSKDYLYRDFMLFNDDKELKNNRSYTGLAYFIYKNTYTGGSTPLGVFDNYKVAYNPQVKENDEFLLDDKYVISFSNIRKPGISGAKNKDLLLCKDDKEYKIYTSIKSICFIGDSSNKKANKVKINGQFVDLRDALEIVEQGPFYAYIIDCEKYQLQNGWVKIELVNIVDNKTIDKYKFLYDETLETQENLISNYAIDFKYNGFFNLVDSSGTTYNNITLNINTLDFKKYYLDVDGQKLQCKFILTVPYYTVDDEYIYTFNEPLNSEEIKTGSKLYFNVEDCDRVLYRAGDIVNELSIKTLEKRKYIEISELLNYTENKYIDIRFSTGPFEKQILRVYFDIVFDEENSYYSVDAINQEVEFNISLYGKKSGERVFFKVQNRNAIIYEGTLNDYNNVKTISLNGKIQKIHFSVYRNKRIRQGFKFVDITDVIYEGNFAYYPIRDLINKYLVVEGVKIEQSDEDEYFETQNLNLKMVKRIDDFYYLGYLYTNINGKITTFDRINEVRVLPSQVYIDENKCYCCDADICIYYDDDDSDEQWTDPLQYDKDCKTIVNGYDKQAPFIEKYKINLTMGEKQYAEFKSSKKGKIY